MNHRYLMPPLYTADILSYEKIQGCIKVYDQKL
jgi:hypothetical protein